MLTYFSKHEDEQVFYGPKTAGMQLNCIIASNLSDFIYEF